MKMTLLEIVQDIPKSTLWARNNKDKVAESYLKRKNTLEGKLISLITQSKYRSKKSGIEHSINTDFLKRLYIKQGGKCALSGITMLIQAPRDSVDFWYSMSIDRVDSNLGYTEDNVQLVCNSLNLMKKDMPNRLFIDMCREVVNHNENDIVRYSN